MKKKDRHQAAAPVTQPPTGPKPLDPKYFPLLEAFAELQEGKVVDPTLLEMSVPADIPDRPTVGQFAVEAEKRGLTTARLDHNVAFLAPPKIRASLLGISQQLENKHEEIRRRITELDEQIPKLEARVQELLEEETAAVSNFEEYTAKNAKLKSEFEGLEAKIAERLQAVEAELSLRKEQAAQLIGQRKQEAEKILADAKMAASELTAQAGSELDRARTEAGQIRTAAGLQAEQITADARTEARQLVESGQTEAQNLVSDARSTASGQTGAAGEEARRIIEAATTEAAGLIATAKETALSQAQALLSAEKLRLEREVAGIESVLTGRKAEVGAEEAKLQELRQQMASAQQRSLELSALIESHRQTAAALEKENQARTKAIERREAQLQRAQAAFDNRVNTAPKIVEEARQLRRNHRERMRRMEEEIAESLKEARIHMPRVKLMLAAAVVILIIAALVRWLK